MSRTTTEEVTQFLSDMYGVELQALAQLKKAPAIAGDSGFADHLRAHEVETRVQAELIHARLKDRGGSPSTIKDTLMKLGGRAFILFAQAQSETPGRLLAHSYAFEAMEWAGYGVLTHLAEIEGDAITAETARTVQREERAMMRRLEDSFDAVEEQAHINLPADKVREHVCKHLAESHAIEKQSQEMLKQATTVVSELAVVAIYQSHLEETEQQLKALEGRLAALGGDTSALEDSAMKLGAMNWSAFFASQKDTPAKPAVFAYALEHPEIAGYELPRRPAQRAGDAATVQLGEGILEEERQMAERLANALGDFTRATLQAVED